MTFEFSKFAPSDLLGGDIVCSLANKSARKQHKLLSTDNMRNSLLLAFTAIVTLASSASAGMISVEYKRKGEYGRNMNGVTANFSGGTYSGYAGLLDVEILGADSFGLDDGRYDVFCTELNEYASGNPRSYHMDTLANLTIPSTPPAMTTSRRIAIEKLFSIRDEIDSNLDAAGMQVAIWEISQDVNFGQITGPGAGNFFLTGSNSNFQQIRDAANGYLSRLGSLSQVSVLGMVNDGSQDFVMGNPSPQGNTTPIPEPGSLAIFAIGLVGLAGRRRRS